jgi:uncharacterized cupin superfamily protein
LNHLSCGIIRQQTVGIGFLDKVLFTTKEVFMVAQAPFNPVYGSGITVTPTSTSASSTLGLGSKNLALTNLSSTIVTYIRVGDGSQTATAADYPVLPNTQVRITKDDRHTTIAYVSPAGSGSLHIIAGEGY